jgi:hypothetical protein
LIFAMPWGLVRDGVSSTTSPSMWSTSPSRNRHHPTQIVDAQSDKGMRSERSDFDGKSHRHGGCVPARCGEPLEYRLLRGSFVQVHRLRIELGSEPLDVFRGDRNLTAFEVHSQL